MLKIAGHTLDILQESLDCLNPNDLVESVTAYRREYRGDVWYDVRFTLYNMADDERLCYGSARIDADGCVTWERVEQFPKHD